MDNDAAGYEVLVISPAGAGGASAKTPAYYRAGLRLPVSVRALWYTFSGSAEAFAEAAPQ